MQLTDAGQVVHARGLQVLEQSRQLLQEVAEVDGIARGSLSVGIMPTAGHYMAPVIARFQQLHPGVELHVQEQGARVIIAAVETFGGKRSLPQALSSLEVEQVAGRLASRGVELLRISAGEELESCLNRALTLVR